MRRGALWEYIRGALWVLPTIAVVMALGIGLVLSQIEVSSTRWFVFQGTPDDARTLLIAISSTLATCDRSGAGPDRCGAAAGVDAVLAPAAAQLPAVRRPLGSQGLHDDAGTTRVVVPGRDLSYYLDLATGQIRRYGCPEPRVDRALLRVLATTGMVCHNPDGRALLATPVQLVVEDAQRTIPQPADLALVRWHAALVLQQLGGSQ